MPVKNTDDLFLDDFPAADYGAWRQLVEPELRGASFEKVLCHRLADGFEIQPLFTEDTAPTAEDPAGFPGAFPFTRGTDLPRRGASWFFGSEIADPDPAAARRALEHDLGLGAELIWLRLGPPGGLALADVAGCERLLAGVDPKFLHLVLDAGPQALPAAALYLAWARRAGIASGDLRGGLGVDPLGTLAGYGELPGGLAEAWRRLAELASFCLVEAPELRASLVSTAPWHRAGATPAWELGLGLAAGVETLRALESHGIEPTLAAKQILFAHELGSEIFLEIAKLRAARLLWSKVVTASGAGEVAAGGQQHFALGSSVAATRVDPWVNLLRSTAQTFAAAAGGADGMVARPWDAPLGRPETAGRRFALSSQYVLARESHLTAVADPAGGSWAIESLTDALARQAWSIAQGIEKEGGLAAALAAGTVQRQLAELAATRRREVAQRRSQIVGASVFPLLGEPRPARAPLPADPAPTSSSSPPRAGGAAPRDFAALIEAAAGGAAAAELADFGPAAATVVAPLAVYRPAAEFEELRLAADGAAERGARPRIFAAALREGSRARVDFAAGLFPAAGIEVALSGAGEDPAALAAAFAASGCPAAVLCGSDETYAAYGAAAARALKEAGCRTLVLAGRPGGQEAELRAAGVDSFVFLGADLAAALRFLLEQLEVIS